MDNAQKAIMIGVGLFITIIIISAVLLITNMGTGMIKKAETDIGSITAQMESEILTKYDGKVITGAETLEAVRKYYYNGSLRLMVINTNPSASDYAFAGLGQFTISTTASVAAGATGTALSTAASPGAPYNAIGLSATKLYGYEGDPDRTPLANFTSIASLNYISSSTTYSASVIYRPSNNEIMALAFRKN